MKLKFRQQAYQTDAVRSVMDCFAGLLKIIPWPALTVLHQFLDLIGKDLVRLCQHADAGRI